MTLRATELAHLIVARRVALGDIVIDATVGNGHDTLFLADLVGPRGRVIGFDVQEAALAAARLRIGARPWVALIHAGHERLEQHLPVAAQGHVTAAMFNLGYLPGGDKATTTADRTTLVALEAALAALAVGGIVTLVLYTGHAGGAAEALAVREAAAALPAAFTVVNAARLNPNDHAPELIAIERRA